MYAIETRAFCKRYGDLLAVNDLNLKVEKGELFSLLGVNGAGKSTTIKMLSTLTRPTSGDAWLNGHSILHDPEAVKRLIAVSPQETAIAGGLNVRENLELMCGVHGFSREKTRRKLEELMNRLALEEVARRRASKLSGGYQRRLSIAMALVSEPEILFLDEPTLGLDVIARDDLWNLIRALKGKITIVLTTHTLWEAEALSDHVGIMKEGRLLKCATVEEIKRSAGCEQFEQAFIRIVKGEAR